MKKTILAALLCIAAHAQAITVISIPHIAEVPHVSVPVHVTEVEAPHVSVAPHEVEEAPTVSRSSASDDETQHPAFQGTTLLQQHIALANANNARVMAEYASEASAPSSDDVVPGISHRDVLLASIAGALFLGALMGIILFSEKRNG